MKCWFARLLRIQDTRQPLGRPIQDTRQALGLCVKSEKSRLQLITVIGDKEISSGQEEGGAVE